jgi:hypothetical protein
VKRLYPSYAPPEKWRNESQASRLKGAEWKILRQSILNRDNFTCSYCGYRSKKYQVVDHIDGDPENNSDDNFQTICQSCNLVKHSGQGCVITGIVDLYRCSNFNQNAIIIITRTMRDMSKSDDEIRSFLGLQDKIPFRMDREYLKLLFAFVSSRSSAKGDEMYDGWKAYHEGFLKKQPREDYADNILKNISDTEYSAIHGRAKETLLANIPELTDSSESPIAKLLIKIEMVKIARNTRNPSTI